MHRAESVSKLVLEQITCLSLHKQWTLMDLVQVYAVTKILPCHSARNVPTKLCFLSTLTTEEIKSANMSAEAEGSIG